MDQHEDATLVFTNPSESTHIAIKSGNWSDPSIWKDGKVPGDDAKVYIPEGLEIEYDSQSTARLEWVRVDGALDFATDQDTNMLVETLVTGMNSRFTVGTSDTPVEAGVTANIVIADGPIDTSIDPNYLSHGLIAQGSVQMQGAQKSPYGTLDGSVGAGTTTLTLDSGTDGWQVGDTIVVMGTELGKYQDESREIVAIKQTDAGVVITLDSALQYNHSTPEGYDDLDIYVGNESRNIVVSSENPEGVRGHVMMMHTPDVSIQFAEFSELGRTDKSLPLDVGENVSARYPLHLHETGTEAGSEMALLYGNSVHGSPGWGIVQHSSNAAVDYNFVHDIVGAGIVSEDGDETGQWIGNFVTGIPGDGDSFSIDRDEHDADFGHSGVAYENQARQIVQQDNIAANANTGWMFRAATTSVDNPDRDALQFDPMPLRPVIDNEEPAITGFHDNIAVAVDTVIHTGHRQTASTTTDLRSDFVGLTAWEIKTVLLAYNYTGEYVLKDGLFISNDERPARAIVMMDKHAGTSLIDNHFDGFNTAVYDKGLNFEAVYIGNTFEDVGQILDAEYYGVDRFVAADSSTLTPVERPVLVLDADADLTMGARDRALLVSGTVTDTAGTYRLGANEWVNQSGSPRDGIDTTDNDFGTTTPEDLIAIHGAMRDGDGGWIMPIAIWITDRVTGEHFAYRIDIELTGYTDAYLEAFEITDFEVPSGEIKIFDDYSGFGDNTGGSELPDSGGETEVPDTGGETELPDSGGETEVPDTGGETEVPDTGGETELPDSGGETELPDSGGETEVPDTGGEAGPVIEFGSATFAQESRDAWFASNFAAAMEDPVIILGPLTSNSADQAFGRLSDVTSDGFNMQIEEWDYLDGQHAVESVNWMALPSGTYTLGDGRQVTAAAVQTNQFGKASIDLSGFDGDIAVFTSLGSHENDEAMVVRSRISSTDQVSIELNRQERQGGDFKAETVYVVAMEVGDSEDGLSVGNLGSVNHKGEALDLSDTYDELALVASMSTIKGGDAAALRMSDFDNTGATFFVEEEQNFDSEVRHANETVSWVAAEMGIYDLF